MSLFFKGNGQKLKQDFSDAAKTYAVSIGRRAPMHRMHVDCIREISDAGLTPILMVGSSNQFGSSQYDPVKNPLTLDQQKAQFKAALGNDFTEAQFLHLNDFDDGDMWLDAFYDLLSERGIHDQSVVHFRSKSADAKQMDEQIKPLSHYMQGFADRDIPPWQSYNQNPADDEINASDIRLFDLNNLKQTEYDMIAAADWLIETANQARENNPDAALLELYQIPVTVFDLALSRMHQEANISTKSVLDIALATDEKLSIKHLQKCAQSLVVNANQKQVLNTAKAQIKFG